MVRFYVNRIENGKMELEKVPKLWYEDVKAELIKLGLLKEETE